ncbi:MAG: ABC transporter ATP-binding protein [Candidatus Margulisiibacteriota bacterium]
MKLLARLLSYVRPYTGQLFLAFICMIFFSLCNMAVIPLVSQVSKAVSDRNFPFLNSLIGAVVLVFFVKGIFQYGQAYLSSFIGQRVVTDLRVKIFGHLQDLSLSFYSRWKTGEVMSRVINDISMIQNAIVVSATEILPQLLTLVGVLSYLFYLNWQLTLMALLTVPVFVLTISKFGQQMREIGRNAQKKIADISSILQETISGARIVKSFTMEKHEVRRFARESEHSFGWSMKEAQIDATQKPLIAFLQVLAVVAVIWYGCFQVVAGTMASQDLIAFFAGAVLLIDPVIVISKINITMQRALASAERVFELIDIVPEIKDAKNAKDMGRITGDVEFKNVSFCYDKGPEVLKNIDLGVKAGSSLAIVGPSGSGKTSFVNLVLRFYDPLSGTVMVDGIDIKTVKLASLRDQMAVVPQETLLFTATIKENIIYGTPGAKLEAVISAAKAANAHDFIMALKDGYDSHVGERGMALSGGQRQRIAIARAILRDPRILILDEATSSLDTESERLIQDAMSRLMKGRTTFIIAHRLSTIQNADRIIVLKEGSVIEDGTHESLMAGGGFYKNLYELQFSSQQ